MLDVLSPSDNSNDWMSSAWMEHASNYKDTVLHTVSEQSVQLQGCVIYLKARSSLKTLFFLGGEWRFLILNDTINAFLTKICSIYVRKDWSVRGVFRCHIRQIAAKCFCVACMCFRKYIQLYIYIYMLLSHTLVSIPLFIHSFIYPSIHSFIHPCCGFISLLRFCLFCLEALLSCTN